MQAGRACTLLLALLILIPAQARAEDEKKLLSYGGYARAFLTYTDNGGDESWAEGIALLRLKLFVTPFENIKAEFAYELTPRMREGGWSILPSVISSSTGLGYRALDLDEYLIPEHPETGDDLTVGQNLDRAFVTYTASSFDLYAGRLAVAFGTARAVNPTDVLAPYTYFTVAKEERTGVDAVRLKVPTGELGELDMGTVFGEDFEAEGSAAFLRSKSYIYTTDVTLMAMVFRENLLFGVDLTRSIGSFGAWVEAAYVAANAADEHEPDEDYLRVTAGLDYSLTDKAYAYVEYHYNGAGAGDPGGYLGVIDETAYTEGGNYLLGRHYLAPGMTYELTPILSASLGGLINLGDASALVSPELEYNVAEDVYLKIGAFISAGKGLDDLEPGSEFGLYDDLYYASASLYF